MQCPKCGANTLRQNEGGWSLSRLDDGNGESLGAHLSCICGFYKDLEIPDNKVAPWLKRSGNYKTKDTGLKSKIKQHLEKVALLRSRNITWVEIAQALEDDIGIYTKDQVQKAYAMVIYDEQYEKRKQDYESQQRTL